ncbi:hypothetical protein ACQQ2N_16535 [Dokdonella sp. MW10]|uniref:hypothetical protein n=1 Tax=Dokdonella sp. MW10 TaxID=2992926 RepID=UPI003F7E0604
MFWISFDISSEQAAGLSYATRFEAFNDAMIALSTSIWSETTSFHVLETSLSIDEVATRCRDTIAPSVDVCLVADVQGQQSRIVGRWSEDQVFRLMPRLRDATTALPGHDGRSLRAVR